MYEEKIQRMAESNGRSLEVSYAQLDQTQPLLSIWLSEAPTDMLAIFDEVASEIVKERFEFYDRISGEIRVRITDVPAMESIRDLR